MCQYAIEAAPCSIEDIEAHWDYTAGRPLAPPWLVGAAGGHIQPQFEFRPPHLAVHPIATADLAQVDNSAELPLLLLGIVKVPRSSLTGISLEMHPMLSLKTQRSRAQQRFQRPERQKGTSK